MFTKALNVIIFLYAKVLLETKSIDRNKWNDNGYKTGVGIRITLMSPRHFQQAIYII